MSRSIIRAVHTSAEIRNQASGPSHSIPHLICWLNRNGVDASLEALAPEPDTKLDFPQRYHKKWPFPASLGVSPAMRRALREGARTADIIHTHNLWMMPNIYPYSAARTGNCRLVVTPRGTLTRWAFRYRAWKKRPIWWTMQRRVVLSADLLHATSMDERDDLRGMGYRGPIAVLPNGVEIPPLHVRSPDGDKTAETRTLLFLGRIHPKKGIDLLLQAWARLQERHRNWNLEIVGPDNEGHLEAMRALAGQLGVERCSFSDAVFGDEKEKTFQRASLFVLPTRSENFGIAVAEALANGTPAVVTRGAPWAGLEVRSCGWWTDIDDRSLERALDEAMSTGIENLNGMGHRGREWMEEAYSWRRVAEQVKDSYEWLLGRTTRPQWIDV